MRTAIISLLAAGLATSAAAQTAAPVAPTAPTPDAAAAPAAPMAPAAAPAVAPAPEPEKVYAIPTTGEIGQIIDVINRICVPLVRGGDISKLEGPMISQAAQEGDVLGLYAFGKIGEWLGRTMAAVSAVLDPDLFVIGGGVVAVGDILLEPARYNYQRFLEGSAYRGHAKIVAATAGQDAGLIGAANLALR